MGAARQGERRRAGIGQEATAFRPTFPLTWRACLLQRAMPPQMIRLGLATLALLAGAPCAVAEEVPALPDSVANAMAEASPQDMAEYRRKLAEYQAARAPVDAYWNSIAEKRRGRNAKRRAGQPITLDDYVLTQPPVYSGPKKPVDPSAPERPPSNSSSRRSARRAMPNSSASMRRWPPPPG